MPPSASWNRPGLSAIAPVNAPFSWPNSSDSISASGIAPQLTATNGFFARAPSVCSARATSSLPVPLSPVISTLVFAECDLARPARRPAASRGSCRAGSRAGRGPATCSRSARFSRDAAPLLERAARSPR